MRSFPTSPALMGIVNVTPNSFSDTGRHFDPQAAAAHARFLMGGGAAILDLGAEASSFFRQGVTAVDADEQLRRLLPVLDEVVKIPNLVISIDTRSARVARECLGRGGRGAHWINDISAGTEDPEMFDVVAKSHASIILMHISPTYPSNPSQDDPDILATVRTFLADRVAAARLAGIPQDRIAIDPGLGFGKTPSDNWILALRAHELQSALHLPLVLGCSRKRFLETPPPPNLIDSTQWQMRLDQGDRQIENGGGRKSKIENPTHPRDPATAALTHLTLQHGIHIHRLHNPTCFQP